MIWDSREVWGMKILLNPIFPLKPRFASQIKFILMIYTSTKTLQLYALYWSETLLAQCWALLLLTLLFYQIESSKNGVTLILPSGIARNSSAPHAKRIFEILLRIFEGCTISPWPSRPCLKNCQNGTFLPLHVIWIFFGPNDFV